MSVEGNRKNMMKDNAVEKFGPEQQRFQQVVLVDFSISDITFRSHRIRNRFCVSEKGNFRYWCACVFLMTERPCADE